LIHRLDMQTSGLVVVGLTRNGVWPGGCMATAARGAADAYAGYDSIREQFRVRSVRKQYLALAHGTLRPASGIISVPIREARVQRKVTNSSARTALRLRTTVVVRTCAHRSRSLASIRALSRPKHSIRRFRPTLR
jgi:23S rRNA-/tRNA-specific pseudouridylate synthase